MWSRVVFGGSGLMAVISFAFMGEPRRLPMNTKKAVAAWIPPVIAALAALGGAAIGGLASVLTSWWAQYMQARAQWLTQDRLVRQELYQEFIEEATKCHIDALLHDKPDIPALVALYAKISRMRVMSSLAVIQNAEKIVRKIVDTYEEADKTLPELRKMINSDSIDLLREFSETCRAEFETLRAQQLRNPVRPHRRARGG
jgi:hypothetical protein